MILRLAKHTKFDRVCCHKKRLEKTGTGFSKDEVRFRQRTGCGRFKYAFGAFLARKDSTCVYVELLTVYGVVIKYFVLTEVLLGQPERCTDLIRNQAYFVSEYRRYA